MSATGRGAKRAERDLYGTPLWLIDAIVPHVLPKEWPHDRKFCVLEPSCGDGRIVEALLAAECPATLGVVAADIAPSYAPAFRANFLDLNPQPLYDLVITNPPYSHAKEFVDQGKLFLRPEGRLVLLLRINFLGSQKRANWWRKNKPTGIYMTPRRPSFTGGSKTDATEYAWFQWGGGLPEIPIEFLLTELARYT